MKELDFLNIIKKVTKSGYIGDDCAFLEHLGIVVTQDNLAEDIHFKREWCTPFQLGYKSAAVNISDILASGAKPAYVTIGLTLPDDIGKTFVSEFYRGVKSVLHGAEIIGGDITCGNGIFISIAAIGLTEGRKISSRAHAKPGYVVITKGEYGLSSAGLQELARGGNNKKLIKAHLEPMLDVEFSKSISSQITCDYAMTDTSDGLADALFKIAEASGVTIKADYIEGMFGGEDYHLAAAVPEEFLPKISEYRIIGRVLNRGDCILEIGNKKYSDYDELGVYDQFRGDFL